MTLISLREDHSEKCWGVAVTDVPLLFHGNRGLLLEPLYLIVPKLCASPKWKNENPLTGFFLFGDINGF